MEKRNRGDTPRTPLNKMFRLRLSEREYEKLKEFAKITESNMSDIVREAIEQFIRKYEGKFQLKKSQRQKFKDEELETVRELLKEFTYQIRKVGVNLNQVARYANKKRDIDLAVAVELEKIRESLKKLESCSEKIARLLT